jgi:hypothetical protein
MSRAVCLSALLAAGMMVCLNRTTGAQTADQSYEWCQEPSSDRRVRHCEEREQTVAQETALDIDPGRNGGIQVRGRAQAGIRLQTRITASAPTEARARELVAGVRIATVAGRIRSDGAMTLEDEHCATTFLLEVPHDTHLALTVASKLIFQ